MQLGVRCTWKGKVSHDVCRECSLESLHPCGFPPNVLEGMRAGNDTYDGSGFTASTLLECDRRTTLYTSRDHWMDPEHAWYLMRGHMVHAYMESLPYPPGSVVCTVAEKRLHTTVETKYGTQKISGKMDLAVVKEIRKRVVVPSTPYGGPGGGINERVAYVKIVDYKTKKIDHALVEAPRTNQMQINLYAWLVETTLLDLGIPQLDGVDRVVVDEVELVYIDMMKTRRFNSEGVLPARGIKRRGSTTHEMLELSQVYLFPDMQDVEAWIVQRIEAKIWGRDVLPPRLGPDEAWVCKFCPMYDVCYSLPD